MISQHCIIAPLPIEMEYELNWTRLDGALIIQLQCNLSKHFFLWFHILLFLCIDARTLFRQNCIHFEEWTTPKNQIDGSDDIVTFQCRRSMVHCFCLTSRMTEDKLPQNPTLNMSPCPLTKATIYSSQLVLRNMLQTRWFNLSWRQDENLFYNFSSSLSLTFVFTIYQSIIIYMKGREGSFFSRFSSVRSFNNDFLCREMCRRGLAVKHSLQTIYI